MRFSGRIHDWNDARGYGFVVPNGGGERSFVHIKAFSRNARRPADGDLVTYAIARDGKGRSNASAVRFHGERAEARTPRRYPDRVPRTLLACVAVVAIGGLVVTGWLPAWIGLLYGIASGASYLLYFSDKSAAGRRGIRRTPEATLHLVDLLGGWPGGLLAQQRYRHKTVKRSFQAAFWVTVIANIAAMAWLVSSGRAESVGRMLGF